MLLDAEKRDILRFRVVQRAEMSQNRKDGGRSPGFIQSVTGLVDAFYGRVLQQVVPWTPPPPRARPTPARGKEPSREPMADREDLDDAVDAARGTAAGETTGDAGVRELRVQDLPPGDDAYVAAPIATDATT